jgi:ankyrin repeat protein
MPLTFNPFGSTRRVAPSSNAKEQKESLLSPEERDFNTEAGAKNTTTPDSSKQRSSTLSRFTSSFRRAMAAASPSIEAKKTEDALNPSQETKDVYPSQETKDALYSACIGGDLGVVKKLINAKPDLLDRVTRRGFTFLHLACERGHLEVVKELINAKPDLLDRVTRLEFTALHLACERGHLEVVKELINAKPDLLDRVTGDGFTVLHLACDGGHLEVVKELIKANKELIKAKPDLLDRVSGRGLTVLHYASIGGHLEVVKELIEAKRDLLDRVTGRREFTVLHLACDGGHLEVAEELINAKPDLLDKVNKFGETAIFWASERDNKEAVELLIKKGADIYKCDSEGISPIHKASLNLNSKIVEMLFNAGANIKLEEVEKIKQTIKGAFDEYIQDSNSDELEKKQERFDAMNLMLEKITNPTEIQARDKKLNQDQTPSASAGISRSSARSLEAEAAFIKRS